MTTHHVPILASDFINPPTDSFTSDKYVVRVVYPTVGGVPAYMNGNARDVALYLSTRKLTTPPIGLPPEVLLNGCPEGDERMIGAFDDMVNVPAGVVVSGSNLTAAPDMPGEVALGVVTTFDGTAVYFAPISAYDVTVSGTVPSNPILAVGAAFTTLNSSSSGLFMKPYKYNVATGKASDLYAWILSETVWFNGDTIQQIVTAGMVNQFIGSSDVTPAQVSAAVASSLHYQAPYGLLRLFYWNTEASMTADQLADGLLPSIRDNGPGPGVLE